MLTKTRWSDRRLASLADRAVGAEAGTTYTVTTPATGEPLGTVPRSQPADVDRAAERTAAAAAAWQSRSVTQRAAVLERFADAVETHREELLDLLQLESGKARWDALSETLDVPLAATHAAETAAGAMAARGTQSPAPGLTSATVEYEPVGTVGVIAPFNYPMTLSMADVLPALAAGNGVVLLPDDRTPYTALRLAELLDAAGVPDGVVTVVTGAGEVAGPAVIDAVDALAFTGGTETARTVGAQAGRNLIDATLELGGKNPLVVLDDADPDRAARGAIQAAFANGGQLCLAAERFYVDEAVYEPFREAFLARTAELSVGTGLDYEHDVGTLIDDRQLEHVSGHVEDARDRGATVLTGGQKRPEAGQHCYEPTVLTDAPAAAAVTTEETFGPVVRLEPVPSAAAAVERANNSPYGLNASVWTGDLERGRRVASAIECGTVCVNDAFTVGWITRDAPMGGVGDSGVGRRHGDAGFRRFVETQTVAVSRVGPLAAPDRVPTWLNARLLAAAGRLGRRLRRWL